MPKGRPLPELRPIEPAAAVLASLAVALLPPADVSVQDAAAKYRVLENPGAISGPWSHDVTPWLVRPMACLTNPETRLVLLMGPVQSGKSEVGNNWLLTSAICSPASFVWLAPSEDLVGDYIRLKIKPMIKLCPELAARQIMDKGSDKATRKKFRGGMDVSFIWPTATQFRMRSAPNFVIDDFDGISDDIQGEGDPVTLLTGRQTTFEGRERGLVISSPSRGRLHGIEAAVAMGTDERIHVPCPSCKEEFELASATLEFERTDDPADAEASAFLVCPVNGCVIGPRHKADMVRAGKWVAHGKAGDVASFRLPGFGVMTSWPRLARLWREAELKLELQGNEKPLRSFMNTRIGVNVDQVVDRAEPIEASAIMTRAAAGRYDLGVIPPEVQAITAAVDIQSDRFEVGVIGHGVNLETWWIDRFAIHQLDDGRTRIDPARKREHWAMLLTKVFFRRYPLIEDPAQTLPILNVCIDSQGLPGVFDNAKKFWRLAIQASVPEGSITLFKGGSNPKAQLMPPPTYLERTGGGRVNKSGPRMVVPNVHDLKLTLDVRLRRADRGPGYVHFPRDFDRVHAEELTAEELVDGCWTKVKTNNETWDLSVMSMVAWLRHAGERIDCDWVPAWARRPAVPEHLAAAVAAAIEEPAALPEVTLPSAAHAGARGDGRRRGRRIGGVAA